MAIKRLQSGNRPALKRLGKLRKGGEKPEKGLGRDLQYFRFTSSDVEVEAAFVAAYGKQPAMLRVYLPHGTAGRNFDSWKEAWGGSRLKHRCDGEFCVKWLNQDGSYTVDMNATERVPCPGGCKEVGRLEVILPELWHAGFVGLVTMETHSINDIVHISAVLELVESKATGGLEGIEFILRRVPEVISTPNGQGGRRQVEKWLVKIEPTSEWLLAQLERAQREQIQGLGPQVLWGGSQLDMVPSVTVDETTGEVVEGVEPLRSNPNALGSNALELPTDDDMPPWDDEEVETAQVPVAPAQKGPAKAAEIHTGVTWGWQAHKFLTGALKNRGLNMTVDECLTQLYAFWQIEDLAAKYDENGYQAFTRDVLPAIKSIAGEV